MNGQIVPKAGKPSTALITIGLVVLAFGGIMLAGGLGLVDSWALITAAWPICLVIIGIASLMQPSWRWAGVIWIAVGTFMYAKQHRWIDFNLWAVLPPFLMLIAGGAILYRAFAGPLTRHSAVENTAHYFRSAAIFSGTDLRPASQAFTGAELTAVMGGIKLDLTNADIPPEGAALDLFIVMGGLELHMPSDWAVKTDTHLVMAGLADNRHPIASVPTKTLVLRGFVLLGGVEIRN